MWSKSDVRELRKLRIAADDPPPPLPRFHVEMADGGEYHVIDTLHKTFRVPWIFAACPLARQFAEHKTHELNEKHAKESEKLS